MKLIVEAGEYEAPTLLGIVWLVLKHRFHHWNSGMGWVD